MRFMVKGVGVASSIGDSVKASTNVGVEEQDNPDTPLPNLNVGSGVLSFWGTLVVEYALFLDSEGLCNDLLGCGCTGG